MKVVARLMSNPEVPEMIGADAAVYGNLENLYRRPGFMIRRCHQFSASIFARECAAFSLTTSQYGILYIVSACPDLTQISLSGLIGLDRSTTGVVVHRLVKQGYIVRQPHASDRRTQCLGITRAGSELVAAVQDAVQRAYDAFLEPLSGEERQVFMACLDKLVDYHNARERVPLIAHPDPATGERG